MVSVICFDIIHNIFTFKADKSKEHYCRDKEKREERPTVIYCKKGISNNIQNKTDNNADVDFKFAFYQFYQKVNDKNDKSECVFEMYEQVVCFFDNTHIIF